MKEPDVLDEAFAALREETATTNVERAAATRRALLLRTADRRRRTNVVRFVLPFAAVLAVSAAWAAATGRRAGVLGSRDEAMTDSAGQTAGEAAARGAAAARTTDDSGAPDAVAVPASSVPPVDVAALPPAPALVPRLAAPRASTSTASSSAAAARADASLDAEEAAYRPAHEAHFIARDWPKALVGWDAYLAKYPNGRFAPEARYNRALVLLRLGRTDEAREALRPFAAGAYGGYRQHEAKELLDVTP